MNAENLRRFFVLQRYAELWDAFPWSGRAVDSFVEVTEAGLGYRYPPQERAQLVEDLDTNPGEQLNCLDLLATTALEWAQRNP